MTNNMYEPPYPISDDKALLQDFEYDQIRDELRSEYEKTGKIIIEKLTFDINEISLSASENGMTIEAGFELLLDLAVEMKIAELRKETRDE